MAEIVSGEVAELERRWVVLEGIQSSTFDGPYDFIEQAYLNGARNPRVRIVNGTQAILTRKTGKGRNRREQNHVTDVPTARYLMEGTREILNKWRHYRDGFEIDRFGLALHGLTLIEIEKPSLEELDAVVLPNWAGKAVEVTDSLSNHALARIAANLHGDTFDVRAHVSKPRVPRVVLTGGPCSGKSTVIAWLKKTYPRVLRCVPEAATIVIDQVGAKPPVSNRVANRDYQRLMYGIQRSFERAAERQAVDDGSRLLVLDRGTVDGAAYLPGGTREMELVFDSSLEAEYGQYAMVICLDVPPRDVYDANKRNNPARRESHAEAVELGNRVRQCWETHPNFRFVENGASWEAKLGLIAHLLRPYLEG